MTDLSNALVEFAYSACPEPRDAFDAIYLASVERVERCFGPALFASRVPGSIHREPVIAHASVALNVATQSVLIITADSSYRAWQQAQGSQITAAWARAAWRFALTLPIGYVVARHTVRVNANAPSWNPALADLPDYAGEAAYSIVDSSRSLSATSIGLATFQRLFADDTPQDAMLHFALADAFSTAPNADNPLAAAFRRALHKVISPHRHLAYPYWWVLLYNEQLAHRDDFLPLQIDSAAAQPPRAAGTAAAPIAVTNAPPPSPSVPLRPCAAPRGPDPLAVTALKVAAQCVAQQVFTVNTKGALFHVVEGSVYLVVPGGWDRLAAQMQRPGVDGARLEALMIEAGHVLPDPVSGDYRTRFYFFPGGSLRALGATILSRLSPEAVERIFPTGLRFTNNESIGRHDQKAPTPRPIVFPHLAS
jgi:uncharacterized protein YjeT (DUF2065 family)